MSARIDAVDIAGLKSGSLQEAIGPLTLVTGDIGMGKTRVADAVRFGALGLVPAQGRSEDATARLMRGGVMRVRLGLSDGRWVERGLVRDGTRLRSTASASWLPAETSLTEASEAIRRLFGATDGEASALLDFRSILAATPSQRAAFIEPLLDATAMTQDEAARWLAALAVLRAAEASRIPDVLSVADAVAGGMVAVLDAGTGLAVAAAVAVSRETMRAKGTADAMAEANARKREAAESTRRKRAARGEVEDRVQGSRAPAATLDQIDAARHARSDRLAVLRAQVGEALRRGQERLQAAEACRAAQEAHDALGSPHDRAKALADDAARLRAEAGALVEPDPVPLPALAIPNADTLAAADAQDARAAEADRVTDADPADRPAPPEHKPLPEADPLAPERAREAYALAVKGPWAEVRYVAGEVDALDVATGLEAERADIVKRLVALADANGGNLEALADAVTKAQASYDAQVKARAAVSLENQAALRAHADAVEAWDRATTSWRQALSAARAARASAKATRDVEAARVAKANAAASAAHRAALAAREAAADAVHRRRRSLHSQADAKSEEARVLVAAWTDSAAALAEARGRLEGMESAAPVDVAGATAEIDGLTADLALLEAQRQAVEGADARLREMAALAADIERATAEERAWKAVEWSLQRLREMDLAARGGPLVERMTRFLAAAGRVDVPFLRAANGKCAFGWSVDGQEREVEALSGGETCLFVAALTAAVIALCKPEISCLLIDEAERVGSHLGELLAGCEAVRDAVGTIVVMTCNENAVAPRGWTKMSCTRDGVTVVEGCA